MNIYNHHTSYYATSITTNVFFWSCFSFSRNISVAIHTMVPQNQLLASCSILIQFTKDLTHISHAAAVGVDDLHEVCVGFVKARRFWLGVELRAGWVHAWRREEGC